MKILSILPFLPLLVLVVAQPLPVGINGTANNTAADKVIVASLTAKDPAEHPLTDRNLPSLSKRNFAYDIHIDNLNTYFEISLSIGTPPQSFLCLLDTGSSDLWVVASNHRYCQTDRIRCLHGSFTRSKSSTWRVNSTSGVKDFQIGYDGKPFAKGVWGTDVVSIESLVSLNQCSVAIATSSRSTMGVLGVGLPALESTNTGSYSQGSYYTYSNVPALMAERGLINRNAYSLYLGNRSRKNGKIVFGGVDTCAYSGKLIPVPLVNAIHKKEGPVVELAVEMTSFGMSSATPQNSDYSMQVSYPSMLDTGAAFTYLPRKLIKRIYAELQASYDSSIGYFLARCDQKRDLQFGFRDATIKVPLSEFLFPVTKDGMLVSNKNGQPMCAVSIRDNEKYGRPVTLGVNFLRSAYVLFDLENKVASFAQAVPEPSCAWIAGLSEPTKVSDLSKRDSSNSSVPVTIGSASDTEGSLLQSVGSWH